jgi:hypothetical protein
MVVAGIGMAIGRAVADTGIGLVLIAPMAALTRGREDTGQEPGWLLPFGIVLRLILAFLLIGFVLLPIAEWFAFNTQVNVWVIRVLGAFIAFFGMFGEPPGSKSGAVIMLTGQFAAVGIYVLMLFSILPHLHIVPSVYFGW